MNSVGLTLKLQLVKGAVPTIFPEIEAFKNNNKPSSVSHLGPPKRKRTSYGGFEKRNRKSVRSKHLYISKITVIY
jgi:hypothetical protein